MLVIIRETGKTWKILLLNRGEKKNEGRIQLFVI